MVRSNLFEKINHSFLFSVSNISLRSKTKWIICSSLCCRQNWYQKGRTKEDLSHPYCYWSIPRGYWKWRQCNLIWHILNRFGILQKNLLFIQKSIILWMMQIFSSIASQPIPPFNSMIVHIHYPLQHAWVNWLFHQKLFIWVIFMWECCMNARLR